ncbi:MAG: Lrp/AsnC family transcriptional regulator [Cyclobacteriaceae bacterium]|nr:Lrp/AsnC family transcriptional regulator [Cyclobacteriaceae bacterium]
MSYLQKLDAIDRRILEILQSNGKITNAQLAVEVGLSPAPTLERVKKMERNEIITSYHAKLNHQRIGIGVSTFVLVTLKSHNKKHLEHFVKCVNLIDEIIECHHITGAGDFILKIVCKDIQAYQQLMLEKVSDIDGVDNLQSMIAMSTYKDSKVIPIPDGEK